MTREALRVRAFREEDRVAVVALWEQVFPDEPPWNDPGAVVRRKLGIQRELFLVGESGSRIVATVMGGYDGFRGWIYHLAVSSELRRRGFGRAMMHAVERELIALGCPKINLQVRATNHGVIAFYEALGYETEERVSMGKRLS